MKKLIFDIAITGHHSEYISHLVDYLIKNTESDVQYIFLLNPKFSEKFPGLYYKIKNIDNVKYDTISEEDFKKVESSGNVWSSLVQYKVMDRYAKLNNIDHIYSMDYHSIKYAMLFYRPSYTISSILFLLFHRIDKNNLKTRVEFYKRYLFTKWGVRNKSLKRIFILNDQKGVENLNKGFGTNKFRMLPDPIPNLKPLANFDVYEQYGIDKNRKIFLHIGALGDRKGTLEVIESANFISENMQNRVTILLVGKASKAENTNVYQNRIVESNNNTKVQLIWHNEFVPMSMMKSLFDQCDAVLLPYKNAEFSSGILGHAAAANKQVIATGAGLIKELVLEHNLGKLLDVPEPPNIAKKIEELIEQETKIEEQNNFVESHSPEKFAEMVLNPFISKNTVSNELSI